jgi:uncharacterized membrane protein
MNILSNPLFMVVPFALWIGLIAVALYTLANGTDSTRMPFRSARDILDEYLTRRGIDREEYVDRRKALDHMAALL